MLYVECHPDTTLVRTLGIPKREIRHVHSKGNVCNRLSKNKDSIGLVDEDPDSAQPNYLKTLELIEERHGLRLLSDNRNNNRVIVICPTLEAWIIAASREAGINLSRFGLPEDPHKLHKDINLKLDKFEQLIKELIGNSQRIETLKRLLGGG